MAGSVIRAAFASGQGAWYALVESAPTDPNPDVVNILASYLQTSWQQGTKLSNPCPGCTEPTHEFPSIYATLQHGLDGNTGSFALGTVATVEFFNTTTPSTTEYSIPAPFVIPDNGKYALGKLMVQWFKGEKNVTLETKVGNTVSSFGLCLNMNLPTMYRVACTFHDRATGAITADGSIVDLQAASPQPPPVEYVSFEMRRHRRHQQHRPSTRTGRADTDSTSVSSWLL